MPTDQNPPREVLERIAHAKLTPVNEGDAGISDEDIQQALRRLQSLFPELFEDSEGENDADESG